MDNVVFQRTVVDQIDGWLHRITALRTMDILEWQERAGILGNLLEIGVYKGRYFSILARSAFRARGKLLGIDVFEGTHETMVRQSLALSEETSGADVTFFKKRSDEVTPQQILEWSGGPLRFISIDGSHECDDVYLDLALSERILSTQGIIAVDDFLNSMTLGVNEAVHKFFSQPRVVVPVAYIANKLFLAHRASADAYRNAIERAMIDDTESPESKNFREWRSNAPHFVLQRLWGHLVLISSRHDARDAAKRRMDDG